MKLLLLGLMFCDESLEEALRSSKVGVQMAPHLFQNRLLSGLKAQDEVDVSVLNIPPTGSFPLANKKLYSKSYLHEDGKQIGFINLPFIKHVVQQRKLKKEILKWLKDKNDSYIVVYSLYKPFLKALDKIIKKTKVNVCLIQTDAIPGRGGMSTSLKAKRLGDKLVGYTKNFSSFVVLSEWLNEKLEVGDRPTVLTECICDRTQIPSKTKSSSEKIYLYTGSTAGAYGFREFLEAFTKLKDCKLWICGAGDCDEYIYNLSKEYKNIRHFGYLNQSEVAKLRDECDFLINPRRPSGNYTKYSFPSKTAEYLMSEKPVVMYKLEAIPNDYDQYINYLTGNTADEICQEIVKLNDKNYSQLVQKAKKARAFMLENKTEENQANKIIRMLKVDLDNKKSK